MQDMQEQIEAIHTTNSPKQRIYADYYPNLPTKASTVATTPQHDCRNALAWRIQESKNGPSISTNVQSLHDLHAFMRLAANIVGIQWEDQLPSFTGPIPRLPRQERNTTQKTSLPSRIFLTNPKRAIIEFHLTDWLRKFMETKRVDEASTDAFETDMRADALRWIPTMLFSYLDDVLPGYPVISRSHIIGIFNRTEDLLSFPFFPACGANLVTAAWWDHDAFPGFPRDAAYARRLGAYLFKQARLCMDDKFDTPSMYNVLAFLAMQRYCLITLNPARGMVYLSHAKLLLQTTEPMIGTRSLPDTSDMDPDVETELFKRLKWLVMPMSIRLSFTLHRKVEAIELKEEAKSLPQSQSTLEPPQELPYENDDIQLMIAAYRHLSALSRIHSRSDIWQADAAGKLLQEISTDDQKVLPVPIDLCFDMESKLAHFYEGLEEELKWGSPLELLTEARLLQLKPSQAMLYLMQQFYAVHLRMYIRFLPSNLDKLQPPTSAVHQFLHHAYRISITSANTICNLISYITAYTKVNADFKILMLACELLYSVAQMGTIEPPLARQAQHCLIRSVAIVRAWFARIHGNAAQIRAQDLWDSVAFHQWLEGAGINPKSRMFNDLVRKSTACLAIRSGKVGRREPDKTSKPIVYDLMEEALVSSLLKLGIH